MPANIWDGEQFSESGREYNSSEYRDAKSVVFPDNAHIIAVLFPQQIRSDSVVSSTEALDTSRKTVFKRLREKG